MSNCTYTPSSELKEEINKILGESIIYKMYADTLFYAIKNDVIKYNSQLIDSEIEESFKKDCQKNKGQESTNEPNANGFYVTTNFETDALESDQKDFDLEESFTINRNFPLKPVAIKPKKSPLKPVAIKRKLLLEPLEQKTTPKKVHKMGCSPKKMWTIEEEKRILIEIYNQCYKHGSQISLEYIRQHIEALIPNFNRTNGEIRHHLRVIQTRFYK